MGLMQIKRVLRDASVLYKVRVVLGTELNVDDTCILKSYLSTLPSKHVNPGIQLLSLAYLNSNTCIILIYMFTLPCNNKICANAPAHEPRLIETV